MCVSHARSPQGRNNIAVLHGTNGDLAGAYLYSVAGTQVVGDVDGPVSSAQFGDVYGMAYHSTTEMLYVVDSVRSCCSLMSYSFLDQ